MKPLPESVCEHLRDACLRELENGNEILQIVDTVDGCQLNVVFRDTLSIFGSSARQDFDACVRGWAPCDPHLQIDAGFYCKIHRHAMTGPPLI